MKFTLMNQLKNYLERLKKNREITKQDLVDSIMK